MAAVYDSTMYGWHPLVPQIDLGKPWRVYAAGNGAYILCDGFVAHSTDAGSTWQRYDLPGCFSPRCGAFTGDSIGLIVGDNGQVFKTTNGGKSWKQKPTFFTSVDLRFVYFITSKIAVASGGFGLMLKSTDAGETWSYPGYLDLYSFDSYAFIKPATASVFWLMRITRLGGAKAGPTHPKQLDVLRSTDGGNTWSIAGGPFLYGPDPDDERTATDFARDFSSMRVCGSSSASFIMKSDGVWKTFSTANAGAKWDSTALSAGEPSRYPRLFDCATGFATDFPGATVYRSAAGDNGAWKTRTAPVSGGSYYLYDFADTMHGYAVVVQPTVSTVYRTVDGAATWESMLSTPLSSSGTMTAVSFVNPTTGYALANDATGWMTMGSTDGGAHWNTVSRDPRLRNTRGMQFIDARTGWLYGDSVLVTHDGGATWAGTDQLPLDPLRPSVTYTRVQFVDSLIGWAMRSDWQTYRTVDGGANWTMVHNRDTSVNVTIGFAVTDGTCIEMGTVSDVPYEFRLTGGGKYSQQAELTPDGNPPTIPTQIFFLDSLNGWFCDTLPNLYRTLDGGLTWTFMTSTLDHKPPLAIAFRDTADGFLLKGNLTLDGLVLSGPAIFALGEGGGLSVRDQCLFRQMNAMTFVGDTIGWAVGDNFTVYRYYLPKALRPVRHAQMVLSTPVINFGMRIQYSQTFDTMYIANTGSDTLRIDRVTISNDPEHGFNVASLFPQWIMPGDSIPMVVVFAPTFLVTYNALLNIQTNVDTQHVNVRGGARVVGVDDGAVISADDFGLHGYPNPFSSATAVSLSGDGALPDHTTVRVYDALGRMVGDLTPAFRAGSPRVLFRGDGLPAGQYVVQLQSPTRVVSRTLMMVK